jgi:SAM-dependent methyltransferase
MPGAELIRASAENLPLGAAEVDYAVVRFAFHHFEDKGRGLDEIARVLTPQGAVRITNIAPSYMPGWWLYRFFPNAWPVDQERFWPPQRVFNEMKDRGFHPELQVDYRLSYVQIRAVLADIERREISELVIASDETYASGLAQVKKRATTNPNEVGTTELAIADVVATRGDGPSPAHWP